MELHSSVAERGQWRHTAHEHGSVDDRKIGPGWNGCGVAATRVTRQHHVLIFVSTEDLFQACAEGRARIVGAAIH